MSRALQVSANDRRLIRARDGERCAACGGSQSLEIQHRASRGMGGARLKVPLDALCLLCCEHNARAEGDLQTRALLNGWKVRRWVVEQGIAYRVPVFYAIERQWCLIDREGVRVPISRARARGLMVEVYGDEYLEWEAAA